MPAKFLSTRCTINWQGVDDDTPPGHSVATGTDAFVGSISVPCVPNQSAIVYGRGGGFVRAVTDFATMPARLADRAAEK
ncbi:hypothetical protein [Streptomyces sp. NPDC059631]|uniref:hypothetical protein n=1 Tax=unclassified Streptomyces TaxID=2593676 RepID=UPI0036B4927A